jgi:hypothetical protein
VHCNAITDHGRRRNEKFKEERFVKVPSILRLTIEFSETTPTLHLTRMIAFLVLCTLSQRKPKLQRRNITKQNPFFKPKVLSKKGPAEMPGLNPQCYVQTPEDVIDAAVAACLNNGPCEMGDDECPVVFTTTGSLNDLSYVCPLYICSYICALSVHTWCPPEDPNSDPEDPSDPNQPYYPPNYEPEEPNFESGPEGDCPESALWSDAQVDQSVEYCKSDEKGCEENANTCKAAWKANKKLVEVDCWSKNCDKVCKKKHFSWCRGLSTGAIVGIVIAVVVVVALVVGGVVFFVIRKKGSDAGA